MSDWTGKIASERRVDEGEEKGESKSENKGVLTEGASEGRVDKCKERSVSKDVKIREPQREE